MPSLLEVRDVSHGFQYTKVTFKLRIVSYISLYNRHLRLETATWIKLFHLYFKVVTSCLLACTAAALP